MITLKPANSGGYLVYSGNVCVGDFVVARNFQTGYCWWPAPMGQFTMETILEVAKELARVNEAALRANSGPSIERTGRDYVPPTDPSQEPF